MWRKTAALTIVPFDLCLTSDLLVYGVSIINPLVVMWTIGQLSDLLYPTIHLLFVVPSQRTPSPTHTYLSIGLTSVAFIVALLLAVQEGFLKKVSALSLPCLDYEVFSL